MAATNNSLHSSALDGQTLISLLLAEQLNTLNSNDLRPGFRDGQVQAKTPR
jgi:hypothetical protein